MSQKYSGPPKPKMCTNKEGLQCGTEIIWDNSQRCYVNTSNHERHMCANFTPRQRSNDIYQAQQGQPQSQAQAPTHTFQTQSGTIEVPSGATTVASNIPNANLDKPKTETKTMTQMHDENNLTTDRQTEAIKLLAQAMQNLANEHALDRRQRDEWHKEQTTNDNLGLSQS